MDIPELAVSRQELELAELVPARSWSAGRSLLPYLDSLATYTGTTLRSWFKPSTIMVVPKLHDVPISDPVDTTSPADRTLGTTLPR